jgi:hypothetical protein
MAFPFFSHETNDDGEFFALAWCPIRFLARNADSADLVLCFSPTQGFSRFSFHAFSAQAERELYQRGPEHSESVDAALLAAWTDFGVPAFSWKLAEIPTDGVLASGVHSSGYRRARRELCRALYPVRMRVWTMAQLKANPLVLPPADGFPLVDAFAATAENEEILRAATDEGDPASQSQ